MEALLAIIGIWLSANYGFPSTVNHPRVKLVSSIEMETLRYKGLLSSQGHELSVIRNQGTSVERSQATVAFYNDQTETIYLSHKWAGGTPGELSVLVHEMVHHLQQEAGMRYECPAERERLAYAAQEKWLSQFGRSLESEFSVNGLTLLVTTSCAFGMIDPP